MTIVGGFCMRFVSMRREVVAYTTTICGKFLYRFCVNTGWCWSERRETIAAKVIRLGGWDQITHAKRDFCSKQAQ